VRVAVVHERLRAIRRRMSGAALTARAHDV
jgi:hypothetical protein